MAGRSTKKYFVRGVAPRSCSHKSQTSGASRRSRQSWAGVTRTAAKRAAHGRFVPLRQVTRRQARAGNASAKARTAIGRVSCTSTSCDRGRPVRATRRDMDGRRAGKHREMPRDPDGIRQAPAVQRAPEGGDVAELGVREHGRDLQPRGARASDQRQRLTPFLLEGRAGRNLRHRAPIGVAEPRLREIQQRAGQPRPRAGPERGRHRDLAIRDLAQRATVLTRHADRMRALFGKTGAVDDQHAAALGQHLEEPPPDPVGVPGRVRDEMLKALGR